MAHNSPENITKWSALEFPGILAQIHMKMSAPTSNKSISTDIRCLENETESMPSLPAKIRKHPLFYRYIIASTKILTRLLIFYSESTHPVVLLRLKEEFRKQVLSARQPQPVKLQRRKVKKMHCIKPVRMVIFV